MTLEELAALAQGQDETAPLRRERNIGPGTLGALALAGIGVAAARNPRVAAKLAERWQRPLAFAERWTKGRPVEVGGRIPGLPSELPLLRKDPQSKLVSDTEQIGASMATKTRELLDRPWSKQLLAEGPEQMKDIEHFSVAGFLSRMATGQTPSQAKAAALANTPQWFQEANAYRAQQLLMPEGEQWAKRFMGMERIPERWGPYLHRQTIRTESASLRPRGGYSGELRTSLMGAEHQRQYPTMRAGEQAGVRYDDPRVAWLSREVAGLRLIETAKYLQRLEGRVVFRNKGDAERIAGSTNVHELLGLPGSQRWWVPHYEEWKFLTDNLRDPEYGQLGFLRGWSNAMARNPNLINPLPHIVKNMAYKYRMAGGKLSQLPADFAEFRRGTSPNVVAFHKAMPHSPEGETAASMFNRAVHGIRRESYPAALRLTDLALDATIGKMHRASSKVIFGLADPAMRFSLWKQYVAKGFGEAEAAQHVWTDLIRYGTRSTIVDAWKSVPFNFFVPWRLGTTTTLFKQLTDHPWRTAAFIGAVDLLREIRYRQSGRWTHLPIDYIETPIAQIIQGKNTFDSARSLVAATLATIAFGPGGGFAAAMLIDIMKDIQAQGDWGRLKNVFWGLSQMVDGGKSGVAIFSHLAKGDKASAARDATNLFMTAATAEHTALNYRPRRLMAALPEVGPWLTKSAEVKMAEALQQKVEVGGEKAQARRERWKSRGTIEERVRNMMESQK